MACRAIRGQARVRGDLAPAEASRKRRARLFQVLDQAAAFYERYLWESEAGAPVREYLEARGLREAVCREFRLGLSAGRRFAQRPSKRASRETSSAVPASTNARGNDYFPRRLVFPLADARGRIVGFQARKLHEDDPLRGKYVNSPRASSSTSRRSCTGSTSPGTRSRSRSAESSWRAIPT